jgi:hypothetical protein
VFSSLAFVSHFPNQFFSSSLSKINQHQIDHNKASIPRNFAGINKGIRCNGLHIHSQAH